MSQPASSKAEAPHVPRPRGRPPLPASDIALRKSRIIEAASRLFFAHGYADTTLESIGREAGVTKRTIYELIGDKDALFSAACNALRVRGPYFEFTIPVAGRSVREVLKDMGRRLIEHSLSDDLVALVRAVMIETTRCPEIVSDVLVGSKSLMIGALSEVFQDMAANGLIRPIDFDRAADLFFDTMVGARGFRAALGHPPEHTDDTDLDERVELFVRGYLDRATA